MIEKRVKLIILCSIAFVLLLLPSVNQIIAASSSTTNVKTTNSVPNNSYSYNPTQLNYTGTNIGLKENATAVYQGSPQSMGNTPPSNPLGDTAMSNLWTVPFPGYTTSPDGVTKNDWKFSSAAVTVSGLSATNNWLPGTPSVSTHFPVGSGWTAAGAQSYSDPYWPSQPIATTTQVWSPAQGTDVGAAQSSGWSETSTDFLYNAASNNQVGYIQLQPAIRSYTYNMNTYNNNSITATHSQFLSTAGYTGQDVGTPNCQWGGGVQQAYPNGVVGANTYYSANVVSSSSTAIMGPYNGINQWAAYGDPERNSVTEAVSALNTAGQSYTMTGTRLAYWNAYFSETNPVTTQTTYAWVSCYSNIMDTVSSTYIMPFYYQRDYTGYPNTATMSFNLNFGQQGATALTMSGVTEGHAYSTASYEGYILYAGSSPGAGSGGKLFDTGNQTITSNAFGSFPVSVSAPSSLAQTGGWYTMYITVTAQVQTLFNFQNQNTISGGTVSARISACDQTTQNGFLVTVSNPQVAITETSNIAPSGTLNVGFTSSSIAWNNATIPAGNAVNLIYGYEVPTAIASSNGGLGYGYTYAQVTIYKTGYAPQVFYQEDPNDNLGNIGGVDKYGYGIGCSRFIWPLTSNSAFIAALNGSQTFTIQVGVALHNGFMLNYNTPAGASIYFNNINFVITTCPSAAVKQLEVAYIPNIQSPSIPTGDTFPLVDNVGIPTSTATITCSNFYDNQSVGPDYNPYGEFCFIEPTNGGESFNFQASFTIQLMDWNQNVTMILTPGMTYFELNTTIWTPKPLTSTNGLQNYQPINAYSYVNYTNFLSNWQDNFNFYLIIPKYTVGAAIYWNLTYGVDTSRPIVPTWDPLYGTTNPSGFNGQSQLLVEQNPAPNTNSNPVFNLFGSTVNNGNIQVVDVTNATYSSYIAANYGASNGTNTMKWNFLFQAPSDVGNVQLAATQTAGATPVFSLANSNVFYLRNPITNSDYINIQGQTLNNMGSTAIGQFVWESSNMTIREWTNASIAATPGTFNSHTFTPSSYQLVANDYNAIGSGWYGYSVALASNVTGSGRTGGSSQYPWLSSPSPWLGGPFRGGMNYTNFAVRALSSVVLNNMTNTIPYVSPGDNSSTSLFVSSIHNLAAVNDPNNMINLSIRWTDYNSNPVPYIPGNTNVTISISSYNTVDGVTGIMYPYQEISNVPMQYSSNGVYWINLDPMSMQYQPGQNIDGNISRGFHNYTISCNQNGFDPINFVGNFSIQEPTTINIQQPSFGSSFTGNSTNYPYYDANDLYTTSAFTQLVVNYQLNRTDGVTTTLSNDQGSWFAGNVYMMYNLTNVYYASTFTQIQNMTSFINDTYFAQSIGPDPIANMNASLQGWPDRGFLHTTGFGSFVSNFTWPDYISNYSSSLSIYSNQANNPVILQYNLSAWVLVNRTFVPAVPSGQFQMQDFQQSSGLGLLPSADPRAQYSGTVLLKLNSALSGNYTEVVVDNNYASQDGSPFAWGIYNPDLAEIAYPRIGKSYNPYYSIENYQNNASTPSFAIRVDINCTYSKNSHLGATDIRSGWDPSLNMTFVNGPVNNSLLLYKYTAGPSLGQYINQTWMGNASVTYVLSNGETNILSGTLTPDALHLWNCTANSTGVNPFTAFGVTYVTPTINWASIPASVNAYTMKIAYSQQGYIPSVAIIYVTVNPAPTVVMNGSKPLPDPISDIVDSSAHNITISTPIGIPVSFAVNYTDITNFNMGTDSGTLAPISGASLTCYANDSSPIWLNSTQNPLTPPWLQPWEFIQPAPGNYDVTILNTNVINGVTSDLGFQTTLWFQIARDNYTAQYFAVDLNITKRPTAMVMLPGNVSTDMYYYYPSDQPTIINQLYLNSPFNNITKLAVSLSVLDLQNNSVSIQVPNFGAIYSPGIEVSYTTSGNPYPTVETTNVGYIVNQYTNMTGGYTYNFTLANTLIPGVYTFTFLLNDILNYYNSQWITNITIVNANANMSVVTTPISKTTVSYNPPVPYQTSSQIYLPIFTLSYIDANRLNKLGQPIQYPYTSNEGNILANSNFTNALRDGNDPSYNGSLRINPTYNYGFDPDTLFSSYLQIINQNYNLSYTECVIDTMGINVLADSSGNSLPQFLNVTLNWPYYNPTMITMNFTITNATTALYLYSNSVHNEVAVKTGPFLGEGIFAPMPGQYNVLGTEYSSYNTNDLLYDSPCNATFYGYEVQAQIFYRSIGTQFTGPIQSSTPGDFNLLLNCSNPEINTTIYCANTTFTGLPPGLLYSIIQFAATPLQLGNIEFNFSIWKTNFNPVSYTMIFPVKEHTTSFRVDYSPGRLVYGETFQWNIAYLDTSSGIPVPITTANIYLPGNSTGVYDGGSAIYGFPDGSYSVMNLTIGANDYQLQFTSDNLNVGEFYNFNVTFSQAFFQNATAVAYLGTPPSYYKIFDSSTSVTGNATFEPAVITSYYNATSQSFITFDTNNSITTIVDIGNMTYNNNAVFAIYNTTTIGAYNTTIIVWYNCTSGVSTILTYINSIQVGIPGTVNGASLYPPANATYSMSAAQLQATIWLMQSSSVAQLGIYQDGNPEAEFTPEQAQASGAAVYIFVKVFVSGIEGAPDTYPYQGITITVSLYDYVQSPNNSSLILGTATLQVITLTYDPTIQLFTGVIHLTLTPIGQSTPETLNGLKALVFNITSTNSNYVSPSPAPMGLLLILTPQTEIPTWVIVLGIFFAMSMIAIGGYGTYKLIQLRIPYVLRMIDESIDKISKDKFPSVGVMLGRNEFVINKVIDYLDECGIEWSVSDKIEKAEGVEEGEEAEGGEAGGEQKAPMTQEEIVKALNDIKSLTADEREMFIDEIKRLDRKQQDEFLKTLQDEAADKK